MNISRLLVAGVFGLALSLSAEEPARPPITGVSHIALWVHDLDKSRQFYKDFLGFGEPYSLTNTDGGIHLTFIKINNRQTIELFPEKETNSDRLNHICMEVPDIEKAKAILEPRAAKIGYTRPLEIRTGINRKRQMNLYDPDGTRIEVMESNTVDGVPTPSSTVPF